MIKFLVLVVKNSRLKELDGERTLLGPIQPSKSNQYDGKKMFNDRSFAALGNLPCKVTVRRSSFFLSFSPPPFARPFAEKLRNVLKKFPLEK